MKTSLLHLKSSLQLTKGLTKVSLLVAFSTLTLLFIADVTHAQNRAAMQKRLQAAKQNQKQWTPPPIRLPEAVIEKPKGPVISVKEIDRGTTARKSVTDAADAIDTILESEWSAAGIASGEGLTDEQFVRRVYLDLGGRIPRLDEAKAFFGKSGQQKRIDLIDDLLTSPDYVSHFYNFWADILRLKERPDKNTLVFEPYMDWVKQSIAENTPYDEWVFSMLTADGKIWDNPATGYQLRDRGMALPYIDNTVRVFLGTQIGCAQCHDHPFDKWTQKQFYELAALTSGTRDRVFAGKAGGGMSSMMGMGMQAQVGNARQLAKELNEARKKREVSTATVQFLRLNTTSVNFKPTPLKLPHDYQYDNGAPNQKVDSAVLWGKIPEQYKDADGRTQFAAWLTAPDNRQFARAIANRLWKKMFGVGVVEPVDDFQDGNIPASEKLLEHLTDEMLRLDFDIREFIRVICSTKAWQSRAIIYEPTAAEPFLFTAPALKRMSAEQLWDSTLTLVANNEWAFQRPSAEDVKELAAVDLGTTQFEEFVSIWKNYNSELGRGGYTKKIRDVAGYKDQMLVRSSELPLQTLPLSHFLSQFGVGDRDSIQSSSEGATVPQVLTMFNGWTTHTMLERGSVIYDNVAKQKTSKGAVDTIFLSILARRPTVTELGLSRREIESDAQSPAAGCGNLIWALLNTREFMFIQ
jgi:hypothetical protein